MAINLTPYTNLQTEPILVAPANKLDYFRLYSSAAVSGILRRHRLEIKANPPCYQTNFVLGALQKQAWFDLFGAQENARRTPFTYFKKAGTMVLMRILADVGVNFRHMVHLKCRMAFHDAGRLGQIDEPFILLAALKDGFPIGNDQAALMIETHIGDSRQTPLATYDDVFIVNHVRGEEVTAVTNQPHIGFHDAKQWTQPPQPRYPSTTRSSTSIEIPLDAGVVYGKLTGDRCLVFTKGLNTPSFSSPNPFVPGMLLANHVLKTFTTAHKQLPKKLDIHFAHPTYAGQTVEIVHGPKEFAVCDANCQTLAIGACQI